METFKQEQHVFVRRFIFFIVIMNPISCNGHLDVTEMEKTQNSESTTRAIETESISTLLTSSFIEIASTKGIGKDQDYLYENNETDSLLHMHNELNDDLNGLLFPIFAQNHTRNVYTDPITFRKCCAKHERFDPRLKCISKKLIMRHQHLEGEEKEVNDIIGKKYPWFPSHILSEVSPIETVTADRLDLKRVKVQYASRPKCDESQRLILQWYKEDSPFFFILISDGSIVELDSRNMETIASWPVDSYCLDSVPSKYSYYIAILCPCIHSVCIRKCCPIGFYYNIVANNCSQFQGPSREEYEPKFYEGYKAIRKKINYYLLRKMPKCIERKIETLSASQRKGIKLYIEQDGSILLKIIKWKHISNSRYCVDRFVDRRGKETTNILYCMRKSKNRSSKVNEGRIEGEIALRNKSATTSILSMKLYLLLCIIFLIIT